jgi:hypothetical protein
MYEKIMGWFFSPELLLAVSVFFYIASGHAGRYRKRFGDKASDQLMYASVAFFLTAAITWHLRKLGAV